MNVTLTLSPQPLSLTLNQTTVTVTLSGMAVVPIDATIPAVPTNDKAPGTALMVEQLALKATKAIPMAAGNLATLDAAGQPQDSGTTPAAILAAAAADATTKANAAQSASTPAAHAGSPASSAHSGLGTAAPADIGTTAGKVIALDNAGKLPAVDGSQLTGIVSGSSRWTRTTGTFTATPASTSTLAMTSDISSTLVAGTPIKYKISTTYYYGIVSACTSNLLTICGVQLSGDVLELWYGVPEMTVCRQWTIAGYFEDAANSALLSSDAYSAYQWEQREAFLVKISVYVKVADSGATQPAVNISVAGNKVSTSNSGNGLSVQAGTWVSTGIDISATNYACANASAIELTTTKGANGNASDLTVKGVWVLP